MKSEIAIINGNTLATLGLYRIMKSEFPNLIIRTFSKFEDLIDDTPDMYTHYFISVNIYMDHYAFFEARGHKTIVLSEGKRPMLQGIPFLDVSQSPDMLRRSILNLKNAGHKSRAKKVSQTQQYANASDILSRREIDVLRMVVKGFLNKEIADKLNIGLTTVITHRKNLTEKLGIKSVPELTIYALSHGVINMDEM